MIKLGQEVKDRVSGFQGIAVAWTMYLQGCARVTIQPKVKKDGTLSDSKTFDEPDLIVVGDGVPYTGSYLNPPGGPHDHNIIASR